MPLAYFQFVPIILNLKFPLMRLQWHGMAWNLTIGWSNIVPVYHWGIILAFWSHNPCSGDWAAWVSPFVCCATIGIRSHVNSFWVWLKNVPNPQEQTLIFIFKCPSEAIYCIRNFYSCINIVRVSFSLTLTFNDILSHYLKNLTAYDNEGSKSLDIASTYSYL